MKRIVFAGLAAVALATTAVVAQQTKSPVGAEVYFITPKNGDTVAATFRVQMGLKGMGIAPAGIEKENTGHHHLIINTKLAPAAMKESLPADAKHVHFGGGQTEATVTLPAGTHTLQLVLGDQNHIPHDPPVMSEVITVTVK
jgi:Domain of unknown function (DUF4399)